MEILGYIGYGLLLFFAVTWNLGVRTQLSAGIGAIMGALFYTSAAIVVPLCDINLLHSWWLIPAGFVILPFIGVLIVNVPIALLLFRSIAYIYSSIIRVGISPERIQHALHADAHRQVNQFMSQRQTQ